MAQYGVTLDEVLSLARCLSALDKVRLVERIMPDIEQQLETETTLVAQNSLASLYGAWADLGPAPSEADIREVRQEFGRGLQPARRLSKIHRGLSSRRAAQGT